MEETRFDAVGLMSGTSLDGLDLCLCTFVYSPLRKWKYTVEKAETVPYDAGWLRTLSTAQHLSGADLIQLDRQYGDWLGKQVRRFLNGHAVRCVASHGHTLFHAPAQGFTFQLGSGAAVHAACGLPVVADFRSIDVALGGEGAPLVPAGERILFSEYSLLLNLGGIANITFQQENGIVLARDIAFANMALNRLASLAGLPYDNQGRLAAAGRVSKELTSRFKEILNPLSNAKSLSREQFENTLEPLLLDNRYILEDKLCTYVNYLGYAVEQAVKMSPLAAKEVLKPRMLVTGGGAENNYLIRQLKEKLTPYCHVLIPDIQTVQFKEAIVFAFLGLLRLMGRPNALASVTGADRDSIGGALYGSIKL